MSNYLPFFGSSYFMAIPHNSKCRYGERGTADAKPKAQIILDAAKVRICSRFTRGRFYSFINN